MVDVVFTLKPLVAVLGELNAEPELVVVVPKAEVCPTVGLETADDDAPKRLPVDDALERELPNMLLVVGMEPVP